MNYLANFNQSWWETCLRDVDSDLFIKRGWPLLGPNKGQNKKNIVQYSKIFFSLTTGRNALIFGMQHPWGKEIQVCSNKVPGVINGHALRGHNFI